MQCGTCDDQEVRGQSLLQQLVLHVEERMDHAQATAHEFSISFPVVHSLLFLQNGCSRFKGNAEA